MRATDKGDISNNDTDPYPDNENIILVQQKTKLKN
jgi:hypothetical protein